MRRNRDGSDEVRGSVMGNSECIQDQGRTWPKVAIIILNWNGWCDMKMTTWRVCNTHIIDRAYIGNGFYFNDIMKVFK